MNFKFYFFTFKSKKCIRYTYSICKIIANFYDKNNARKEKENLNM